MREIKFRAWNTESNIMSIDFTLEDALKHEVDFIDNSIYMQYTGLKDKNGVEIYEGDIVKWNSITDNRYISSVCFKNGQYYPLNQDYTNIKECEVIGNIYKNPELLDEKRNV